ncbi:hypothetical protein K402DRAFT_19403 [Aulographum hederae CBS 113979]|uniref:Azaphilone pigments biosynthesis cluster protein L N-terminal domain-containing protein n=1 Tax=Aulographum hederae CBS 113979 TaxID=1176131 RepID=A0A6G1H6I1_9PEZI|nr:hypothetical protein K402DRAFT_19403 [Aulographum hederae CBS 113979]
MDPLSIAAGSASAATACFKVSAWLYLNIQEARTVDQTVRGLCEEVQGLAHIIDFVRKIWASNPVVAQAQTNDNKALWEHVSVVLGTFERSMVDLESRLDSAEHTVAPKLMRRLRKHISFSLSSAEISNLRERIQNYNGGISVALNVFQM